MGKQHNNWKGKISTKNQDKIAIFVRWYVDTKERTEKSYMDFCYKSTTTSYDYAMINWLKREDVQEAIKGYMKEQRIKKTFDIYEAMYDKATKGDVNSAKWCMDFFQSDFFEDSEDEMDNYLSGINIPALKKSGGK